MSAFLRDVRIAARGLRRSPGFTAAAVAALALGLGANAAIFSLVNAVLLRPLPFPEPDRLVALWGNVQRTAGVERRGTSYPDFLDWRASSRSFDGMAAFWDSGVSLRGPEGSERLTAEIVSPAYLTVLGVTPALGRGFTADEETPDTSVALISHALWTTRFGGDPAVLGRPLALDGQQPTIVGVLPAGFRGLTDAADVWLPTGAARSAVESHRGSRWFAPVARLAPGVSIPEAQAELATISRALEAEYPETNGGRGVEVASVRSELVGPLRPVLLTLLGAVAFVLLIAGANVAGLLLTRAEARQREIGLRMALGAGRRHLVRQFVAEGLLLSLLGASAGILLALWVVQLLVAASPVRLPAFFEPALDAPVTLTLALLAVVTGVALGMAPAWHLRRAGALAGVTSSRAGVAPARQTLRSTFVVAQMALALVLLAGAGLLIGSLQRLLDVDPGFAPAGVLSLRAALSSEADGGNPDATEGGREPKRYSAGALIERIEALPGVRSAALGSTVPLNGPNSAIFYSAEGHDGFGDRTRPRAYIHRVTPGYFATVGLTLRHGRDFRWGDSPRRVIVSQAVADRFWPGQDPIGRRVGPGRPDADEDWWTIVGVVNDARLRALPRNPTDDPDLFLPFDESAGNFAVLVKAAGPAESQSKPVTALLREIDPQVTTYQQRLLQESVTEQTSRARFTAWIAGAFALLALLLAALGVYGVVSYVVARRTQEFGIRAALGARPRDVFGLVLRRAAPLVVVGLAVGLTGAAAVTRLLSSLLYEVSPLDPTVYLTVTLLLASSALLATSLPARRATRLNPVEALREE